MNPFLLSFSDGTIFFIGLAIVLLAEALLFYLRHRLLRPLFTVTAVIGIVFVIISATPLALWAYLVWVISALAGIIILNRSKRPRTLTRLCGIALTLSSFGLCLAEAPYHFRPRLSLSPETPVYVLGDSISAGIGTNERPWPQVLDATSEFQVVNLAQAGATVSSAITQAERIVEAPAVVILAIGGNDLLGQTDATDFRATLDKLVASLRAEQHRVLLLELPLFPFQNAYGKAQRDVARKHACAMLPKRCFSQALGTKGGTIDGLHLSQKGHNAMAGIMTSVLELEHSAFR